MPRLSPALGLTLVLASFTAHAIQINNLSPQGEVAQVRQIVAKFDDAAVTFGDPKAPAPLSLRCSDAQASKGSGRWVSERAAFIVGNILSDSNARARTFGTDSILAMRFWTAVKTGTSKAMRDNWAIGYSQRYTVGVWVDNASGAPMWDVSGTTGAAPIWAAVMNYLHRSMPSRAPTPPAGVVQAAVSFAPDSGDVGAARPTGSAL